ncbi:hypothetical protein [Noviherbaspirillum pedocola]|nr:hypothetical protein [Noviherbaspirillum pedocola]
MRSMLAFGVLATVLFFAYEIGPDLVRWIATGQPPQSAVGALRS